MFTIEKYEAIGEQIVNYSKEDVEKLVKKMLSYREKPSEVVLDLIAYENKHLNKMSTEFGRYITYFEHAFDLLVNLVTAINYIEKSSWPNHRGLQLLILKNNLNPLYSGFGRLVRGFYDDANILLRAPYEALVKIIYISYYPQDFSGVFNWKRPKGMKAFNLTNFLRDDLKVDWDFIYPLFSSFSHGNIYTTLTDVVELDRKKESEKFISFKLEYSEDDASIPMNMTVFLQWSFIRFCLEVLINTNNENIDRKLYQSALSTEVAFGAMIGIHPKGWARTHGDVIRIFEEIRKMENVDNPFKPDASD